MYTLTVSSVDKDGANVYDRVLIPIDADIVDYLPKVDNIVAMSIEPQPPKEVWDILEAWMSKHINEMSKDKATELAREYRSTYLAIIKPKTTQETVEGMVQYIDSVQSTVANKARYTP